MRKRFSLLERKNRAPTSSIHFTPSGDGITTIATAERTGVDGWEALELNCCTIFSSLCSLLVCLVNRAALKRFAYSCTRTHYKGLLDGQPRPPGTTSQHTRPDRHYSSSLEEGAEQPVNRCPLSFIINRVREWRFFCGPGRHI